MGESHSDAQLNEKLKGAGFAGFRRLIGAPAFALNQPQSTLNTNTPYFGFVVLGGVVGNSVQPDQQIQESCVW